MLMLKVGEIFRESLARVYFPNSDAILYEPGPGVALWFLGYDAIDAVSKSWFGDANFLDWLLL
jgi:hypothetical protein